jgi:hypothetical protein
MVEFSKYTKGANMSRNTNGQFTKGTPNPNLLKPVLGQKYGKLTVISEDFYFNSDNRPVFTLQCECGNMQDIKAKDLRRTKNPRTACSDCLRKEAGIKRMQILGCTKKPGSHSGIGDITKTHYLALKRNATFRNKECFDGTLPTLQFLWELYVKQGGKCALSGLSIQFGKLLRIPKPSVTENSHDQWQSRVDFANNTASLDRIDSNKGYTEDNVQWVHKDINMMKMDLSEAQFKYYCKLIAAYDNHEPSLTNEEGATTIPQGSRLQEESKWRDTKQESCSV